MHGHRNPKLPIWEFSISCFCLCFTACLKTHFICFIFSLLFLFYIFFMNGLLYMTCYCNSTVTSYFVALLNQTTQVKTLPIAHITQFHNFRPRHVSDGQSHQRLEFEHGSIHLALVTLKVWKYCMAFSRYFPSTSQYHHTTTTYSHYNHSPHYTISQFYTVFN